MDPQRTFRFKIINVEFYNEIKNFSEFHKYENKDVLKESYKTWCEQPNIKAYFKQEEDALKKLNYDLTKNNIYKKVFKSIKYYHIKRILYENRLENFENNIVSKRQKTVIFSKELLSAVKNYLKENENKNDFKPSTYFEYFCEENKYLIEQEKSRILNQNIDIDNFNFRFKKMFKNQYFKNFKEHS
jgi:hypothetical protein